MPEDGLPPFNVPTTPTPLTNAQDVWSQYFGDQTEQQYIISDLRERHVAIIQQDGDNFIWFHRKTSGTVCPFFNSETGQCAQPLEPNTLCFNTGYLGGYDTPLMIKIAMPTSTKQLISMEQGLFKVKEQRCWTLWVPVINDRDLLINARTGVRFEAIDVVQSGPWRGLYIAQYLDLRQLQAGVDFGMNVVVNLPTGL